MSTIPNRESKVARGCHLSTEQAHAIGRIEERLIALMDITVEVRTRVSEHGTRIRTLEHERARLVGWMSGVGITSGGLFTWLWSRLGS